MTDALADVLGEYMQRAHSSAGRLSKLSKVPAQTIKNWLSRRVTRPREWQGLAKVAAALHLSDSEASRLLQAGGYPALPKLRATVTSDSDRALLAPFQPLREASTQSAQSPFQAIPDLPTFIGREAQLTELKTALLNNGHAVICGLRGMGGVGKTSLAAHLTYQLQDQFPDGVLWARLDTSDTLAILAQFAESYGLDVRTYHDVESRAAVVRNLLHGRRALIVLDNAETSAQVRPLLPPSTSRCAILVTSRNDLSATDGWPQLILEPFDARSGDSLQLFERYLTTPRVRRNRAILIEIAELLGHLPLALAIVAGQLQAQPEQAIPALLEMLRQSSARLGALTRDDHNVRLSFDASFNTLSEAVQRFFAALGVFSGEDFGAEMAAFVTETTMEATEKYLRQLEGRSLIQASRAGRWRLHPLLRDYARDQLRRLALMELALDRNCQLFIQITQGTFNLSGPLEAELSNITFALDEALNLGLHRQLIETTLALLSTWHNSEQPRTIRRHLRQALEAARILGEAHTEVRLLSELAVAEIWLGQIEVGEQQLQTALQLARDIGQTLDVANILRALGKVNADQGNLARAEQFYAQSLALARELDDKELIGRLLNNLGLVFSNRGLYAQAEILFRESLDIFRQIDSQLASTVIGNLGEVYEAQGDFARAEALYAEALSLVRASAGGKAPVMFLSINLAEHLAKRGEHLQAEGILREALQVARKIELQRDEGMTLAKLGDILRCQGRWPEAEACLHQSLEIARAVHDQPTEGAAQAYLGDLRLDQHSLAESRTAWMEALTIARATGASALEGDSLLGLARLAAKAGKPEEATQFAQEAIALFEKLKHWKAQTVREWLDDFSTP